jgi:4a-hydroxytetrahydrobiopterin dehydratase
MAELHEKVCVPCQVGTPTLTAEERCALTTQIEGWSIVDHHHLEKEWRFPDFVRALAFVNTVGAIAEEQGHHPEVLLAWGRALVRIWTYKVDGLTESDFTLAAIIDRASRRDLRQGPSKEAL